MLGSKLTFHYFKNINIELNLRTWCFGWRTWCFGWRTRCFGWRTWCFVWHTGCFGWHALSTNSVWLAYLLFGWRFSLLGTRTWCLWHWDGVHEMEHLVIGVVYPVFSSMFVCFFSHIFWINLSQHSTFHVLCGKRSAGMKKVHHRRLWRLWQIWAMIVLILCVHSWQISIFVHSPQMAH